MQPKSKSKTLLPRVLVAVGLGGAFLASLIDPLLFVFLAAIAAMAGTWELSSALRHGGWNINRWAAAYLTLPVIGFSFIDGARGQWLSVLVAIAMLSLVTLTYHFVERQATTRELLRNLSAGVFVMFYVPLSLSFAVLIITSENGTNVLFSVVLTVAAIDTFGYLIGRFFGRTKFAPGVSPKKTWEGFIASVFGALLVGISSGILLMGVQLQLAVLFSFAILLAAVLGDLAESLIKRDLGIKDMGDILPGHGGVMDRLDSMLPAAFMGYLFTLVFL
ncbi:MAG: CDP-archaeol synthase [Microbacteriaceae bacterium]|jgi:phosphatidate cytidylyltransferase|nr:CDP-archaeol synthase [Microbacteriaceae bacterium]MDR9443672.1 CDP-archaeol synthase [Microbacteriaceae bacterium]